MMSRMRPAAPPPLLAAAALALAACGDSGDDDDPTAPTRAEFIAKTDALCQASNARTKALNARAQRRR